MAAHIGHGKEGPNKLPFRSYLYAAPANRAAVAGGFASEADALVLDLEDLTPAAQKAEARLAATAHLAEAVARGRATLVRINAAESDDVIAADLDAVIREGLVAVRLPKSEDPARIRDIARRIEDLRVARGLVATIGLQVMVETARGIEALPQLVRATHTIWSLGLGEGDLKATTGVTSDTGLHFARSAVTFAARAAGLPAAVQVAYPPEGSEEGLVASTRLGRDLGFGARSLLNPQHVAAVHAIYTAQGDERGAAA